MFNDYRAVALLYASSRSRSSWILLALFGVRVRRTLVGTGTGGAEDFARFAGKDLVGMGLSISETASALLASSLRRFLVRRVSDCDVPLLFCSVPLGVFVPLRGTRVLVLVALPFSSPAALSSGREDGKGKWSVSCPSSSCPAAA